MLSSAVQPFSEPIYQPLTFFGLPKDLLISSAAYLEVKELVLLRALNKKSREEVLSVDLYLVLANQYQPRQLFYFKLVNPNALHQVSVMSQQAIKQQLIEYFEAHYEITDAPDELPAISAVRSGLLGDAEEEQRLLEIHNRLANISSHNAARKTHYNKLTRDYLKRTSLAYVEHLTFLQLLAKTHQENCFYDMALLRLSSLFREEMALARYFVSSIEKLHLLWVSEKRDLYQKNTSNIVKQSPFFLNTASIQDLLHLLPLSMVKEVFLHEAYFRRLDQNDVTIFLFQPRPNFIREAIKDRLEVLFAAHEAGSPVLTEIANPEIFKNIAKVSSNAASFILKNKKLRQRLSPEKLQQIKERYRRLKQAEQAIITPVAGVGDLGSNFGINELHEEPVVVAQANPAPATSVTVPQSASTKAKKAKSGNAWVKEVFEWVDASFALSMSNDARNSPAYQHKQQLRDAINRLATYMQSQPFPHEPKMEIAENTMNLTKALLSGDRAKAEAGIKRFKRANAFLMPLWHLGCFLAAIVTAAYGFVTGALIGLAAAGHVGGAIGGVAGATTAFGFTMGFWAASTHKVKAAQKLLRDMEPLATAYLGPAVR